MEIADTQFILDLRRRIQANKDSGKPEAEGIQAEDLRRMLVILRASRTTMALKNPAARTPKTKGPSLSEEDLKSLFS
jgi:hypothetical protein